MPQVGEMRHGGPAPLGVREHRRDPNGVVDVEGWVGLRAHPGQASISQPVSLADTMLMMVPAGKQRLPRQ